MDTIEAARATESQGLLSKLPSRLHHNAFVVKDHEVNRRFFEDLLGIPLVATWCEKNFSAELQREVEFCHTFFAMADGGALAFFQFADPELYEMTQAEKPAKIGRYDHIAFKAEPETYEELKHRLERAGEKYRETNHGYCKSIYVASPDGLIVEFTQDPEDVAEIDADPPRRRAQRTRPLALRRPPHQQRTARPRFLKRGSTALRQISAVQSCQRRPRTRANSDTFAVTSVVRLRRAWAAINRS